MAGEQSDVDYTTRLERARVEMRKKGIGLLALSPGKNMRYLVGFSPIADERPCYLLVSDEAAALVVPGLNEEQVRASISLPLFAWADSAGPDAALRSALAGVPHSPALVAVDNEMRADFLLRLQGNLGNSQFTTASVVLDALRQRKSPAEVARMRASAKVADAAVLAAIEACRPGVTEIEAGAAAERCLRAGGVEEVSFIAVASGPNSAFPHHLTSQRVIQDGDSVVIDLGASLKSYQSDITRTVFVGSPSEEWKRVYACVLEANRNGRAGVKPGARCCDVDGIVRSTIERSGYGEYFIHRTGHGIGMDIHEAPWISPDNDAVLEEGMAFSIEPGVYLPGRFGVRVEDIVVVTADGCERLTGLSHEPVVVEG